MSRHGGECAGCHQAGGTLSASNIARRVRAEHVSTQCSVLVSLRGLCQLVCWQSTSLLIAPCCLGAGREEA